MHNEFSLEGKTVDSPIISQQLVVCHVGIALLKLKRRKKYLHTKMRFYSNSVATFQPWEGVEGGGTLLMKGVGMLVVSLGGANFGFWSHLGCSGQNAIIFSCEGLV